ncbi:uncharacterized protein LOC119097951 [Pollicipes pollicipes]|uniref:uncharacterized protein LOC119097951 n=1 Tax=Pollicipes pollicipes TaxID=41117 RepID=UPI00188503F0|nr:uncharacterized protein LOC119097951 [Pollicipes pollicipes]
MDESSVELVGRLTCVASCIDVPCVLVGNEDSCLVAVDLVLPLNPRIVWTARVCEAAVTSITVSPSGRVAVVLTADGGAYLLSAQPSAGFSVRAQLQTDGTPTAVDTFQRMSENGPEDMLALLVTSAAELLSFVRLVIVRDLEVVGSVTYGLNTVCAGLAMHSAASVVYTMAVQDRSLCCFTLREPDQLMEEQVSDLIWKPDASAPSEHELRRVLVRTVGRFVLTAADDGMVRGRPDDLNNKEKGPLGDRHSRQTHQASSGGVRSFEVQPSGKEAALVGFDGTLMRISLPYNQSGSGRRRRSTYFENPVVPEARYVAAMRPLTQIDLMTMPPTWRELTAEQAWRRRESELVAIRERIREGVQTLPH